MKKITFIAIVMFLLFNSVHAQVLWSENFESYTLGNVGTDVTGTVPGQGNWYTQRVYTSDDISNENFRINHETGRGKRSEERRVGKECRSRRWQNHYVKD